MYQSHFRCFRGCPGQWPLTQVIYTCPTCGGLLEVHHDIEALWAFVVAMVPFIGVMIYLIFGRTRGETGVVGAVVELLSPTERVG